MKVPYKFKNCKIAFKSNYNSIASVDSYGTITRKKKGRVDIGIYIYATDSQVECEDEGSIVRYKDTPQINIIDVKINSRTNVVRGGSTILLN